MKSFTREFPKLAHSYLVEARIDISPAGGIYETATVRYYIDDVAVSKADFLAIVEFAR